ncbi:MFS transporter [Ornithinimicrobium sp. LYQ92]|uniref:MFS transporter n=1 Tax=Serinicoccus sp. LYQ92 TaxID=3378798 RepID=UPI0038542FA1
MSSGRGVISYPPFARLWLSDTVKWLGIFTSGLALQLLLIQTLDADQVDLGIVRSAQQLPMLLFGLVVGVLIERVRRRPVLVAADATCALALGAIGVLGVLDLLTIPLVAALMFVLGAASMCSITAHQSFLPRLVPTRLLPSANARIEQSMTAAESVGPLLAGVLVRVVTAPVALLVNAATYAVSAVLVSTIRVTEDVPPPAGRRRIWRDLREGARYVYTHRVLAPYAVALHVWFFFNSAILTVLVFYATVDLGLGPVQVGLALACAGVAGVVAAGITPFLAERFGLGVIACLADWLTPLAFVLVALAPVGEAGLVLLVVGQLLYGTASGLKGPLDLSYRNAVTPDRLRARMNATIRSLNWGTIVVAAPLSGWLAASYGNRTAIWAGIAGLTLAAVVLTVSPYRQARMSDAEDDRSDA